MKREKDGVTLRWIAEVSGSGTLWVFLLTLIRMLQGIVCIVFAYTLRNVVDSASAGLRKEFLFQLAFFALWSLLSMLLLVAAQYVTEKARVTLEKAFRMRVFSQLLRRDHAHVTRIHSGEWMNRMTSDVAVVEAAMVTILPTLAGMLVRVTGAVASLLQLVPALMLLLVPGTGLILVCSYWFRKWLKRTHKAVQQADGAVRVFLQERLSSLLVVRTFTQEAAATRQASDRMDALAAIRMRRARYLLFGHGAMSGAFVTIQVLGIGLCGWGILEGTLTYGTMSTVLYLINLLDGPLSNLSALLGQYASMLASAERLMEVEGYPLDSGGPSLPPEQLRRYYAERFDAIGLRDASFAYETDAGGMVLQNFNLEIRKGEFIAFTGQSGCGKSTALKLLLSLYPLDSGCAYLRGTDGSQQPLTALWRGLFAYVPQGNQLISGTIRETMTFGDPVQMTQEDNIWQALKIACADSFVADLPQGLDTLLGERGSGLSEGQMQRLAIARAVLSQRPILLLDEATSALDAATETQLLANLRAMTDRTVLIITHREAALDYCDKHIRFRKQEL